MKILVTGRAQERALSTNLNENFANLDDDRLVLRLENVTENTSFVVPLGYRLSSIDVVNTTANAVTGGINIGTAALGAQITSAGAIGASAIVSSLISTSAARLFVAAQTVFISAVTAWNSANLTVVVMLDQTTDV